MIFADAISVQAYKFGRLNLQSSRIACAKYTDELSLRTKIHANYSFNKASNA